MRVLVTGASGMLGRDLVHTLEAKGHEAIAPNRHTLDITDGPVVWETIREMRPAAVVNCAAWTDVDGAEEDEAEATRVNEEGAAHLAAAASSVDAPTTFISSDYVFDGASKEPYLESDPPGPLSAYGRSKLRGERSVAAANERHLVVRTSWLFGTGGHNFVETMLRLASQRDEVRAVDDQVGCPTYTRHLAEALAELVGARSHGILHLAAAGHCSWREFAQAIFEQSGVDARAVAISSEAFQRPAPRPAYSVLRSERRDATELPHWRDGLAAYLAERAGIHGEEAV